MDGLLVLLRFAQEVFKGTSYGGGKGVKFASTSNELILGFPG